MHHRARRETISLLKANPGLRFGGVFVALVAMVATACIRFDAAVTVDADGTGTVEFEVAISDSFAEVIEAFSEDGSASTCEGLFEDSDLPSGALIHPYSEDGWCGFTATGRFRNFDLSELYEDGETGLRLWKEAERVYFEMDISDLGSDGGEEMSFEEVMAMAKAFAACGAPLGPLGATGIPD